MSDTNRIEDLDGCFNQSADIVKRVDTTWSDTNLDTDFKDDAVFERLKCRNCGCLAFEVLSTGSYETAGKCINCNMYYLVHCG